MDVRLMTGTANYFNFSPGIPSGNTGAESVTPEKIFSELFGQKQTTEKVMMDLKDMQNFLYILIGSRIRIEPDKNSVGSIVNTVA